MIQKGGTVKKLITIAIALMLAALLAGCTGKEEPIDQPPDKDDQITEETKKEEPEDMSLFKKEWIVGKDILSQDINDFYYTKSNINYDAYYQRYRFYTEDGKHFFFHETRERPDDYGPCTEEDTTLIGTIELSDEQWASFYDIVSGGKVKAREESIETGGEGPWMFLYWTGDKEKYQEYSYESYGKQVKFEELCRTFAGEPEKSDPDTDPEADGKGSPEDYIANDHLIFDYYEATVATVDGNDSEEFCLYSYTDSQMILAYYNKPDGSEETMSYCLVPASVLDDCMSMVKKYKMNKWKDGRGLNGKRYVVKFPDGDGLMRVSSDDMPENGREAFMAICDVLSLAYADGEWIE